MAKCLVCIVNPIRECTLCGLKYCDDHYFTITFQDYKSKGSCEGAPRHLREPLGKHDWKRLT